MIMEKQLQLNKRALSEMVGYTLLIIIAIVLSVAVFTYLKLYIPKEKPECLEDTSILIQDIFCDVTTGKTDLKITLYNNGLHKTDAAYIRYGKKGVKAPIWLNDPDKGSPEDFYFYSPQTDKRGFLPSEKKEYFFGINVALEKSPVEYSLEVQPAIFSKNIISACKSIFTQQFQCKDKAPLPP